MTYSRQSPSPRYLELLNMYRQLHVRGEENKNVPPEETFPGRSLMLQVEPIKRLIDLTGSRTVLDYGSGKGMQYTKGKINIGDDDHPNLVSVQEYWGVEEICCYDPAFEPFSRLPEGQFDGVISTDVLEHCPEEDIPWILDEMFGYARRFVFAIAACYPAIKQLPNGENAHCTIQPPEWWSEQVDRALERHPHILCELWTIQEVKTPEGEIRRVSTRVSNEHRDD